MKRAAGALLLLLLAATAARAQSIDVIEKRHALRVGMFPGLMPFVAINDDARDLAQRTHATAHRSVDGREVAGFDVDLAAAAADALGVPLEIVLVPKFDDLLPGLAAGKYDVVMSGLTRTLPRARLVSFSDPYFASGLQVLTPDPARFPTLASVGAAHARVAVRAGTTAETFARDKLGGCVVQPLPTDDAVMAAVAQKRADAAVLDYVNARDAEVRGRAPVKLVAVEDRRFTVEHFAFAVRHGDGDWLGWLNLMLRETKASGEFHQLAARYNAWFRSER
jgi:polar amino acid transport system substrate-binding protein